MLSNHKHKAQGQQQQQQQQQYQHMKKTQCRKTKHSFDFLLRCHYQSQEY